MERDIFILAGQSNMVGRGSLTPARTYPNASRIYSFNSACAWVAGADPLHTDDATAGIGPGMAFADTLLGLLDDPAREIGLVPCGKSGSSIAEWAPRWRVNSFYGAMLKRAQLAAAAGLIWYQGETDAQSTGYPLPWLEGVRALIENVRRDLQLPKLPAIITKLGPSPQSAAYPMWTTVQAYADQIADVAPHDVAVVSAADLTPNTGDPLHLNANSAVVLGQRYASAMYGMLNTNAAKL
jgi:hypothetical protein